MAEKHRWTFFRAGGFDQVKIESAADLMNLGQLDLKLWVALACPTIGLEIDSRSLELIDTDKNGRVRPDELIAAVQFAGSVLKNPEVLLEGASQLALSAINESAPEGKVLLASAKQILKNIGKPNADFISVHDISDRALIFAGTDFNGDGVITELSTTSESIRSAIALIMECVGSIGDLSGTPGIDAGIVDTFFGQAKAYQAWQRKGDADPGTIFPIGKAQTAEAVEVILAIKPKVDDFFSRCRLAAYDPRSEQILNRKEEEYLLIAAQDLSITTSEISNFPLSQVTGNKPLPLFGNVNPAHAQALASLSAKAITPLLGEKKAITEADWKSLLGKIAPYQTWFSEKTGDQVEKLGETRITEILSSDLQASLNFLIEKDKALEAETASIEQVERLVRYHRDLVLLCKNFVNFKDFYDGKTPSVFQCGTLFLDQRECRLCLRVEDPTKHAVMAGLAGAYLAYLDCVRAESNEKMQIVAAFTVGGSDNLMVGRNGIFYDRKSRVWDATIVKIVDNPISIRQAFWSPYKKFVRFLEEQVNKRAAAADAEAHSKLADTATSTVNVDKALPVVPKKVDVGTVAAIGVAAGAIGTFVTALIGYLSGVIKLGILPTVGAFVGLILLISLPSVIMAFIKLRKRNLGPILDSNGWAVNAKAKFNVPFGATLTSVAKIPAGSRRDSRDSFAEKGIPWKRLLIAFLVVYGGIGWLNGSFDRVLPAPIKSSVLKRLWATPFEPVPRDAKP